MNRRFRFWPAAVIAALVVVPLAASANEPQTLLIRAFDPAVRTERTYFVGTNATDADAIDFRLQLIDTGARNVNLILPDRVIVCDLPRAEHSAPAMPAGFARATALEVESGAAYTYRAWSWIIEAYRSVDGGANGFGTGAGVGAGVGTPFKDAVITIPPERAEEIERNAEKSRAQRGLAPRLVAATEVSASSSLLAGSILANFIFPESNGAFESNLESWSDADLAAAKQGAVEAMISWQGAFPKMDINFVFRMHERVETNYEPILHNMNNDPQWVIDVLRTLGYGQTNDMIAEVHEFNQDLRALHGTQWAFSAFIASSRNTPNNKFGGGAADYTAYAFLGGPCMIEPFPAGSDINGVGERLVYSQIVNHEVGHCFWTLDEYPGAPGACGSSSGYLNYSNGNLSTTIPGGGELRCNPLQNCIMHVAARQDLGRPWCNWSQGHLGVIDNNGNGYPDVFEARPRIEFDTMTPDTVTTNAYTLRFKVIAGAVPNRNPNIAPAKRVNYALPLRRGYISLSEQSRVNIDPIDGRWDEAVEDCEFHVQLAQSGASAFAVTAVNTAGFTSLPASKVVHFVGVNYSRAAVTAKPNRNDVTWEIAGDPFGARFDVYRAQSPGSNFEIINSANVPPAGPPRSGFIPYVYADRDIVAGREYRYFVRGRVTLAYEDSTSEDSTRVYPTDTRIISQSAMLPIIDDVISEMAPNPTRGAVTFSVSVPRIYVGPETAPRREATPVEVSIFTVSGQRVRTLKTGNSLDDVMTLHWDGHNEQNQPVPSGVYFVRAQAGSSTGLRKIVLLR